MAVGEKENYYEMVPASAFYDDLRTAYELIPDYTRVYEQYSRLFSLFLFQSTVDVSVKFSGNFARTSYLLREHNASPRDTRIINDTRVRIRNIVTLSDDDKKRYASSDLEAVATLVSVVTGTAIPEFLSRYFTADTSEKSRSEYSEICIRIIVDSFDDDKITGHTDEEGAPEIIVSYVGGKSGNDNSYIKDFLSCGTRLNLIAPVKRDGMVCPDHIVYEPDMLVDVTSIASCFQDYATTSLINIVNKFRYVDDTPAIELGNLAGQFLDEEVNLPSGQNTFAASMQYFYKNNPLSLITSGVASERNDFIEQARQQKENIRSAIRHALPGAVGKFRADEIILEPSFISEMLGLQGRMDFLQLDKKVVIEQKAGKCGFPQHTPTVPVSKLQHYIQVLLYMTIIRYNYNSEYIRNRGTQAFLLYSRYKESLLALDFAPKLVHEAFKIRNEIVFSEYRSTEDGYSVLDTLMPGELLQNTSKTKFFNSYIEPSISSVLSPIHNADELARTYFHRFVRFVATEHVLSRIGNHTKANSGFASAWNDSLDEKLQAGNIYSNLILEDVPLTDGKVETLTLHISNAGDNDTSNFRKGDIVMLYPYARGTEPDARKTIVFRCTITEIKVDSITLKLRAAQSDPNVIVYHNTHRWAVEHDFMESSYVPLYRGLHSLLTISPSRRDLILMQRKPDVDATVKLNGDYGTFNSLMLRVKQAQDIYLILGPPGSGKTSFGMLNTLKEQLTEPGTSVLLLSYTNRAVDEICSKLVECGMDFVRVGSHSSCSPQYIPYLISERVLQYPHMKDFDKFLRSSRVYVGTVTALNAGISLFKIKSFNLAIIDEASQILEPHLMPLLCATNAQGSAIRKFVMIGDHKQLPAVVQQTRSESLVKEEILKSIGLTDCRNSLFQRFFEIYGNDDTVTSMLTRQGRMHHDIAAFSSHNFYEDRLLEVPLKHQQKMLPTDADYTDALDALVRMKRMAFIAVDTPKEQYSDKVNQNEADVIAALAYRIYSLSPDTFDADTTLGIIVPYRNQISTIRNTIARRYGIEQLQDITIDTVERYQGSQRKYIIYGFTVSRIYQLNFLTSTNFKDTDGNEIDRKLNVAMTRAMEHMYLVGNPKVLCRNKIYADLIAYNKSNNCYYDSPLEDIVHGRFTL